MWISEAYAQAAAGGLGGAGAGIVQFLPIILVVFIMYMLMWRPQQKKMREHKAMIAAVKRGDRVVAAGQVKVQDGSTVIVSNNPPPQPPAKPTPQ